jgi:type II secretory pathway pseudopilin PulG
MSKPPGDDPIAAEIQAEITDHLATAAEQLQSQGAAPNEARQRSQAKFGDAAAISRRCYWIKQGDTLMFRTAIIALLTILCLALGFTAFSSYRSQHQMAEQMALLAEQLKAIAGQQRTAPIVPPTPAEPKPLEITGQVYNGSPNKPSANTDVMICRVSDGEIVRRVRTRGDGAFQTGPLGAGDYTAIVKSSGRDVQSRPIYLHQGASDVHVPIDATYYGGDVAIELSQPLPRTEVPGKYTIASRLYIFGLSTRCLPTRWTTARPSPEHWPVYVYDADKSPLNTIDFGERFRFTVGSERAALANEPALTKSSFNFRVSKNLIGVVEPPKALPAGPFHVYATIVSDILPHDFADAFKDKSSIPEDIKWMDQWYPYRQRRDGF